MKFSHLLLILLNILLGAGVANSSALKSDNQEVMKELISTEADIVGVDLVVAGKYNNGPFYSRWGHAFLVFINKNERHYYNNVAISFVADMSNAMNESTFDLYYKGATGGMKLTVMADYFYYFWQEYLVNEGREFERIVIPLNSTIRQKLFEKIRENFDSPEKIGPYKFITNNCVVAAANLLKSAGVPIEKLPKIPMNAKKTFIKSEVTQVKVIKELSPMANLPALKKYLQKNKIITYAQFNNELLDDLAKKFGASSTYAFISSDRNLYIQYNRSFFEKYASELKDNNLGRTFKQNFPLYQLCEDKNCADWYITEVSKIFPQKEIAELALNYSVRNSKRARALNAYELHSSLISEAFEKNVVKVPVLPKENKYFSYYVSKITDSNLVLTVCQSENKTERCSQSIMDENFTQQTIKIPMEMKGKELYLHNKVCVDIKRKEFVGSCGLIAREGMITLMAY